MAANDFHSWPSLFVSVLVCLTALRSIAGQPEDSAVQVSDSGNSAVGKFATAAHIYIELVNTGDEAVTVTVTPTSCCLRVDEDDTDCESMQLKPSKEVTLDAETDGVYNSTATVTFTFRNLYARYRVGNCSFDISCDREHPAEWIHTVRINTYPAGDLDSFNCTGIDQDPDRDCLPVDCAIKYRGTRNFYRNSTGRCEPVVDCNTRGKDGITTVAYYDWEENKCERYDWLDEGENSYSHVESDTEIPVDVDPSRAQYFPDFEPHLLEKQTESQISQLNCNHGYANGIYCVCDEGWTSSGIHKDNPLVFHWCDTWQADTTPYRYGPRQLTVAQEISAMIALVVGNVLTFAVWLYLIYKLCCWEVFAKVRGHRSWRKMRPSPSTEDLLPKED